MTAIAGNIGGQYPSKAAHPERLSLYGAVTIGGAGAVGAQDVDDPGMVFVKNGGTGDYTLSFPIAPRGMFHVEIVSPAGTIKGYGVVAFDPTTGTLNFITHNGGGTATNPASSDVVKVFLVLDVRG